MIYKSFSTLETRRKTIEAEYHSKQLYSVKDIPTTKVLEFFFDSNSENLSKNTQDIAWFQWFYKPLLQSSGSFCVPNKFNFYRTILSMKERWNAYKEMR